MELGVATATRVACVACVTVTGIGSEVAARYSASAALVAVTVHVPTPVAVSVPPLMLQFAAPAVTA